MFAIFMHSKLNIKPDNSGLLSMFRCMSQFFFVKLLPPEHLNWTCSQLFVKKLSDRRKSRRYPTN